MSILPVDSAPSPTLSALPQTGDENAALRAAAQALEAQFIAEMLRQADFGAARDSFGGGAGEDQFASLLTQEHAASITERGGIGLAESIFHSLLAREASGGGDAT